MQFRKVLVVVCLLPTVFGCGCPPPPGSIESLCNNYQWSNDVFAGRVINASCNCIPPRNDNSYGPADISCLSGEGTQYFTTEVVAGATCDSGWWYALLSCDAVLNKFQPIGKFVVTYTVNTAVMYLTRIQSARMKDKCLWIVFRCALRLVQIWV